MRRASVPQAPLAATLILVLGSACVERHHQPGYDTVVALEVRRLGFELGGRLLEVNVKDGERVTRGQRLGALDDAVQRAERPVLEAQLARAEAQLDLARKGARGSDVRAAKAQLSAADAAIAALDTQLKRVSGLFEKNAIPKATLDDLLARRDEAKASRDAIWERLRTLEDGSRPEEVAQVRAARDGAKASLDALDARLGRYVLTAPFDGRVIDALAEPGEIMSPGATLILLTEPRAPIADLYVPIDELAAIALGAEVTLFADGDPAPCQGKVELISPTTEFTPRYLLTEEEKKNLVTRVRVRLDDPSERLRAGVPAKALVGKEKEPRAR